MKKKTKAKAVIYVRTGISQDGSTYAGDVQRRFCQEYARHHQLHVVREYSTIGTDQEPFQKMIRLLKRDRTIRVVIVWSVDRLPREVSDWTSLQELAQQGVVIHSVREGILATSEVKHATQGILNTDLELRLGRRMMKRETEIERRGKE